MNTKEIEQNYINYIIFLKDNYSSIREIKQNKSLYEELAEKTLFFTKRIILRTKTNLKYINMMSKTGYTYDMLVDDIALHIIKKMDYIFASCDEYLIKRIISLANNKIVDIVRQWYRDNPHSTSVNPSENDDYIKVPLITHVDDLTLDLLAAQYYKYHDTSDEDYAREMVIQTFACFKYCSRFEVLSLLVTKFLEINGKRIKTCELANHIDKLGFKIVAKKYFEIIAYTFNLSYNDYFSNFKHSVLPSYENLDELKNLITQASYNCAVKLKNRFKKGLLKKQFNNEFSSKC